MRERIPRIKVLRLMAQVRGVYGSEEDAREFVNDFAEETDDLERGLVEVFRGVNNGYLSEIYEVVTGRRVEVVGERESLCACPCCQRQTLTELYDPEAGTGYDICCHCDWEDDGTSDPTCRSSVNQGSIETDNHEVLSRIPRRTRP